MAHLHSRITQKEIQEVSGLAIADLTAPTATAEKRAEPTRTVETVSPCRRTRDPGDRIADGPQHVHMARIGHVNGRAVVTPIPADRGHINLDALVIGGQETRHSAHPLHDHTVFAAVSGSVVVPNAAPTRITFLADTRIVGVGCRN
jgi:hypothetical protein